MSLDEFQSFLQNLKDAEEKTEEVEGESVVSKDESNNAIVDKVIQLFNDTSTPLSPEMLHCIIDILEILLEKGKIIDENISVGIEHHLLSKEKEEILIAFQRLHAVEPLNRVVECLFHEEDEEIAMAAAGAIASKKIKLSSDVLNQLVSRYSEALKKRNDDDGNGRKKRMNRKYLSILCHCADGLEEAAYQDVLSSSISLVQDSSTTDRTDLLPGALDFLRHHAERKKTGLSDLFQDKMKDGIQILANLGMEIVKKPRDGVQSAQIVKPIVALISVIYRKRKSNEELLERALTEGLIDVLLALVSRERFGRNMFDDSDGKSNWNASFQTFTAVLNITDWASGNKLYERTHDRFFAVDAPVHLMNVSRMSLEALDINSKDSRNVQSFIFHNSTSSLYNLCYIRKNREMLEKLGISKYLVELVKQGEDETSKIGLILSRKNERMLRGQMAACLGSAMLVSTDNNDDMINDELVVDASRIARKILSLTKSALKANNFRYFGYSLNELVFGIRNLLVADKNKQVLCEEGVIDVLIRVLQVERFESSWEYSVEAIWRLCFLNDTKAQLQQKPELIEILNKVSSSDNASEKEIENARGALWMLTNDKNGNGDELRSYSEIKHVMLSYCWAQQPLVLEVAKILRFSGYKVWMDVDDMQGSTLEAMANAIENAAVVIMFVSPEYKESVACRLEAEYAYQQRVATIIVMTLSNYKPQSWLGAIMGTKLYHLMCSIESMTGSMTNVVKELGERGKIPVSVSRTTSAATTGAISRTVTNNNNNNNNINNNAVKNVPVVTSIDDESLKPTAQVENKKATVDNRKIVHWTREDVGIWLENIGLGQYAAVFNQQGISGTSLLQLCKIPSSEAQVILRDDLHISGVGFRLHFMEKLQSAVGEYNNNNNNNNNNNQTVKSRDSSSSCSIL